MTQESYIEPKNKTGQYIKDIGQAIIDINPQQQDVQKNKIWIALI